MTAQAAGSITDAAMVISQAKSKVMHVHHKRSASAQRLRSRLKLAHKCDDCFLTFPTQREFKIHAARWSDGGVTQRSRRGSLVDRSVKTAKRLAAARLC